MNIDFTTNVLDSTGGIVLAGKIFDRIGMDFKNDTLLDNAGKNILKSMTGLLVEGRNSFSEIDLVRNNPLFKHALDLEFIYAPETVRIYLERLARNQGTHIHSVLDGINQTLLKQVTLTPIKTGLAQYIPVDIDVSPMDNSHTKKEGVSFTYKKFDGYAPIFSYIGAEGYMLNCELRPGKQHCQKGTPNFLKQTFDIIETQNLEHPILFRMDSGNDSVETITPLLQSPHFFIIKKNLRKEPRERWLDIALSMGTKSSSREGKDVYTGTLTGQHPKTPQNGNTPDVDQVFKVTIRRTDSKGNPFLFPEVEVEIFWTNLFESPETIIDLYHDHGTSEQFHSELKSDMNVERFPSGKFAVNAIILHLAMIAFNTLRKIGQTALLFSKDLPYKHKGKRKRLRKVIDDLIRIACQMVHHANKVILKIWEHDPWLDVFRNIYQAI